MRTTYTNIEVYKADHGELEYAEAIAHFPGGNEDTLIKYFNEQVKPDDWVFSTHRNWYHFLLKTGDTDWLRNRIVNEGNSMHTIDLKRKFISSAIVSGICGPACGTAYAIKLKGGKEWVHAFIGDGATDEGWFYEALRYAQGWDLPITFVVENNDRSVCTPVKDRWGPYDTSLCPGVYPNLCVYQYEPKFPHVGTGKFVEFM